MSIRITAPDVLDDATFRAVSALVSRCNQAESLDLPIPAETGAAVHLLLARLDGDLAGVAAICYGPEAEICLCVAPDRRCRGVGLALTRAAVDHAAAHGSRAPLLASDLSAESGRAFAAAIGARMSYAEHRMNLDLSAVPPLPVPIPGLHIRPARIDDAPPITAILVAAFGDPPAMVGRFVADRLSNRMHRFLICELAGRPISTLRLIYEDGWAYVTTFGVLPELHRQGVGRRVLMHTINMLRSEGQRAIRIEVETDNAPAFGLYQSCGFRRTHTFGYFSAPRPD